MLDGRIPYTGVLVNIQTWGVFVIRPIYRGHRHLYPINKQTNKKEHFIKQSTELVCSMSNNPSKNT